MHAIVAIASAITMLAALARFTDSDRWSIEPTAGVFRMDDGERNQDPSQRFDDQEVEPVMGIRAFPIVTDRWEIGMGYGYTSFESILRYSEGAVTLRRSDVKVHEILGEARRVWPLGRHELMASAGAGVLVMDAGGLEPPIFVTSLVPAAEFDVPDPETEIDPLLSFGIGARRHLTRRLAATIEARDDLQRCQGVSPFSETASVHFCHRDAWLHHLQLTAGLRVEF